MEDNAFVEGSGITYPSTRLTTPVLRSVIVSVAAGRSARTLDSQQRFVTNRSVEVFLNPPKLILVVKVSVDGFQYTDGKPRVFKQENGVTREFCENCGAYICEYGVRSYRTCAFSILKAVHYSD